MSSHYQPATNQEESIEDQLLNFYASDSNENLGVGFSLPTLDCHDPNFLSFDLSNLPTPDPNALNEAITHDALSPTLVADVDLRIRVCQLSLLHSKIEKRVTELDTRYNKLETDFYCIQSRFWSVETCMKQLTSWTFSFKEAVKQNTAKLYRQIEVSNYSKLSS
ncbi:hypothetical protein CLAIMM_14085 [Cladophialophora immunda]|nr:hypothetical protein CLAIMM_14085 [Cladophialophora immunda]